jgi:hypothetical protein
VALLGFGGQGAEAGSYRAINALASGRTACVDRRPMPKARTVGGNANVTCSVAMPWIQPKIRRNWSPLRLQFVRVEPHCHSLFRTAEKGEEHYAGV